ncbi:UDP-N-acetylmuramoylalanine--D-glutamate ligase [Candidatus Hydrogenisulfobacillus filiaventi]|uniref:UDP-N-acetylmuramoylalanine--D-glutamate ligase n=1 Tax=Candidatus Hydrogenisulfobacillus filiaventi TaxID=2707344 RepID=A0A6F8ZFV0_9FIRM|nr:UDP-N-acetylmuramoylalanine--D-glutamate ligase [Candidatus Hydrogenisulfobacillus filiaventi]
MEQPAVAQAIVGLGVNNRPLVPYLLARTPRIAVADRLPEEALRRILAGMGADPARVLVLGGPDYLQQLAALPGLRSVYLTPGMVKDTPELRALEARGVRLTCETDLFLQVVPAPVVGITGSSGKTTTTTLTGLALGRWAARTGRQAFVGGNIGHPLLPELGAMRPEDRVVLELSSFQLERVERSPWGAVLLNLSPNHLDVHGTLEAYAAAKSRIFRYQGPDDWLVVPWGDPVVTALWEGVHRGRRWFFSPGDPGMAGYRGTLVADGYLWFQDDHGRQPVLAVQDLRLPGRHNLANAAAATAAVLAAGGAVEDIAPVLASFSGVPHRLEPVGMVGGVRFINDSIATTPDRTLAALAAVPGPLVVILGGYDKHLDFAPLARGLLQAPVRAVVLLGATAGRIAGALEAAAGPAGPPFVVEHAAGFDEAVSRARALARPGDAVLLSPACASYDMFPNFEVRGERFRTLVQNWAGEAAGPVSEREGGV